MLSQGTEESNHDANSSTPIPETAILLPCYNEAENIDSLLTRIRTSLPRGTFKIIAVDDGSEDATGEILKARAGDDLIVVTHSENSGLGAALRTGVAEFLKGNQSVLVTMDGDDTHDPGYIPRFLELIHSGCDVAVASRFKAGSEVLGLSTLRRLGSWGINRALKILMPVRGLRDYTNGFRAVKREIIEKAVRRWGPGWIEQNGFAVTVEIILVLGILDAEIGEVPFTLEYGRKKGQSKMRISRTLKEYVRLVKRIRMKQRGK